MVFQSAFLNESCFYQKTIILASSCMEESWTKKVPAYRRTSFFPPRIPCNWWSSSKTDRRKIVPVYEWNKGSGGRILFPEPVNKPRGIRPRSSASDSVSTRKTGARGRFRARIPNGVALTQTVTLATGHLHSRHNANNATDRPPFRPPQLTPANQCHALSLPSLNATIHLLIVYVVIVVL